MQLFASFPFIFIPPGLLKWVGKIHETTDQLHVAYVGDRFPWLKCAMTKVAVCTLMMYIYQFAPKVDYTNITAPHYNERQKLHASN